MRESAYRANNLGVALLEQFKYPDAAAAFRRALEIDRSLTVAHLNLSLALFYAQDLQGASREAEEAARLQPDAAQPPYVLGLIARAENRLDQARAFFRRVQAIDPHDPATNINLGQLLLQERNLPQAIAVLRQAAADEPYNATAIYNLGLALTRDGQAEEGRRMLEHSQALRATGYAVTLGTGYLEQGRYAEALASTGLEPELVDARVPDISLTPTAMATLPARASLPASSPFGRRFTADELTAEGARALATSMGGCLTLIDFDRDGDPDVFVASSDGQHLFRNDGATWTDVTAVSGLGDAPPGAVPIGCIAADYDNDGRPDLFVLRFGANSLYRNEGNGHFADVTKTAGLPPYPYLPGAAALVDIDHDGDLDLIIAGLADVAATRERAVPGGGALFPREFVPAPVQLLRNNGNGTFTDITRIAGVDIRAHAIGVAPTDFDNRRDIDLLIVNRDSPPVLFKNLRDGTFRDVAEEVGLAAALGTLATAEDEITAVAVADVNKDDFPDFFFARAKGNLFALSNGRGGFAVAPAPGPKQSAVASRFVDYDNDGLFDLLTWSTDGPHLFRNLGNRWDDVTARAFAASGSASRRESAPVSAHALAVADVDGDGQTDLVAATPGALTLWRNNAEGHGRSVRVRLTGLVSNRSAVGTKVQLRAGSLNARIETSAATPSIAPFDLVFGLGTRGSADVVRVLWPSGILQAETLGPSQTPGAQAETRGSDRAALVAITELNRKPSSCPFLFTWNGARFEFVTDFMGGGELGYWEAPGTRNRPNPIEYVRIRSDQLQPRNGRFEIRVTNELEEALFLDRLQLLVIAHPRGIDVFPNEGMADPPKPFRLYAVTDERVPAHAWDEGGGDVTDRIARLDRRYPDGFPLAPFRGYAAPHALTLDLGSGVPPVSTLLVTGWTDYAFSSDNVAAHQAGLSLRPPSLQVRNRAGAWRDAIADIGIPVGRPQTIALDLAGRLGGGEHEVRIVTNMRIYWDQILIARPVPTDTFHVVRLNPLTATLRARGFSAEVRPDGRDPISYDYARVTLQSPWKAIPGRYTREGDVRELVTDADDMFVIAKPGDEIAVAFDAGTEAPLPDGWIRTFLLLADGFSKEMDINSASPDVLDPLPFHRMTRYPYGPPEAYPNGPKHHRYRERYNTRAVPKPLPPLALSR